MLIWQSWSWKSMEIKNRNPESQGVPKSDFWYTKHPYHSDTSIYFTNLHHTLRQDTQIHHFKGTSGTIWQRLKGTSTIAQELRHGCNWCNDTNASPGSPGFWSSQPLTTANLRPMNRKLWRNSLASQCVKMCQEYLQTTPCAFCIRIWRNCACKLCEPGIK